jgi:hypothetical protein
MPLQKRLEEDGKLIAEPLCSEQSIVKQNVQFSFNGEIEFESGGCLPIRLLVVRCAPSILSS